MVRQKTNLVRMMDDSQFPVRLFDLIVICILLHPQNLVVILALALLEFELGVADFLCDTGFFGVAFGNGLEFLDCFFPVAGLAEGFGLCLAGFGVAGVELECAFAVFDCFLPFLELQRLLDSRLFVIYGSGTYFGVAKRAVLQNLGVCATVLGVDFEGRGVGVDSLLVLSRLKVAVSFFLCAVELLHHTQVFDGILEVGIAANGLSEVLQRLVVLTLCVESASSEYESLGVGAVVAQQRHGNVLCVSQSVYIPHLQVCLTPEQSPLSWSCDGGSKTLLSLIKSENGHGARGGFTDLFFGLGKVLVHGNCRLAVLLRCGRGDTVVGLEGFSRTSQRCVDTGHSVQDFGIVRVQLIGLFAVVQSLDVLSSRHISGGTVGSICRRLGIGLDG